MWYSISKFGSSIQYGWSRPSGTLSSLRRSTGTSGSRSDSTSVSRARVTGFGASFGSSTHTPPTWPVAFAVSSARKAASSPVSCRMSVAPPRVERTLHWSWPESGLRPRGLGQPVGDQPEGRRIHAEAEVTAPHLNVVMQRGLRLDARLPGNDAVPPGKHRGGRHVDRPHDLFGA